MKMENKKKGFKSISDSARTLSEMANDISKDVSGKLGLGKDKASIKKDVEEAVEWVKQRNKEISNNKTQSDIRSMPTLAKVVFGGKDGMDMLSKEDKEKYENFFKANGSRLALLTIINPTVGIGAAGIELVASGLMTKEMANASIIAGTGMAGIGLLAGGLSASLISGVSLTSLSGAALAGRSVLSMISGLWPIGLGVAAVGVGSQLIVKAGNSETEKRIAQVYEETSDLCKSAYERLVINSKELEDILKQKLDRAIDSLEDIGKKVAISLDDIIHNDNNLRLMQYQKIILNQQNDLAEAKRTLDLIKAEYNRVLTENQKLSRQIAAYQADGQMLVCTAQYLK